MSHCDNITDAALWAIARHCTGIRTLVLSGCHQITNIGPHAPIAQTPLRSDLILLCLLAGLRSLSLRCGELETLDFTGCHLLDDLGE